MSWSPGRHAGGAASIAGARSPAAAVLPLLVVCALGSFSAHPASAASAIKRLTPPSIASDLDLGDPTRDVAGALPEPALERHAGRAEGRVHRVARAQPGSGPEMVIAAQLAAALAGDQHREFVDRVTRALIAEL